MLFNGEDEITIDAVIKGGHKFNIGLSTMKWSLEKIIQKESIENYNMKFNLSSAI